MFKSVLIANRGEVAVRIIRACKDLDLRTIAVFSEADRHAMHVRLADEAHLIGPAPANQSYLDSAAIIEAATKAGAEAIHPGYGMLSEDAAFASACESAGVTFIGPPAHIIAVMGDKLAARAAAQRSGLRVLPGSASPSETSAQAHSLAEEIGYPIAVKACFGGGGRGMRVANAPQELENALAAAAREAASAFGRNEVYLEHYLARPRHVEVQIIADKHGQVRSLGDRDCSVQRRNQKLIEEAPAPGLERGLRQGLAEAALQLAREVGYQNAGTVEFLVDLANDTYYFLEMNTRLQVEHAVTELVCGRDIVHLQLDIAAGHPLDFTQRQVRMQGHAIEARIAAEDPWAGFIPRPSHIVNLRLPSGPGIRCDFGVESGDGIVGEYDSVIGKVIAYGPSREIARRRLRTALQNFTADGAVTTAPYLATILDQPGFVSATFDTTSLERDWAPTGRGPDPGEPPSPSKGLQTRRLQISTDRGVINLEIASRSDAPVARTGAASVRSLGGAAMRASADDPVAPMDGSIAHLAVWAGKEVSEGDLIATLEAMKMEIPVHAPRGGSVGEVLVRAGEAVSAGARLCVLNPIA